MDCKYCHESKHINSPDEFCSDICRANWLAIGKTALERCVDEYPGWDSAEDCREELAELRKDRERLEWLMSGHYVLVRHLLSYWICDIDKHDGEGRHSIISGKHQEPRQAIDSAMEADK